MQLRKSLVVFALALIGGFGFWSQAQAQIAGVQDNNAVNLVNLLLSVSGGATVSNETVTQGVCSGTFSGGLNVDGGASFQVDSGVILSSGAVTGIAPPNNSDGFTTVLGTGGDAFLASLIPQINIFDACILEFDFECPAGSAGSNVAFRYNFASEEYNEFVGSAFNDVFGFELNGTNVAVLPDLITPVAINNVNNGLNAGLYNDNDFGDFGGFPPFPIQADGFVDTLTAQGSASLAVNHIKMAIGDASDDILDSWVMVGSTSFECIIQIKTDIKPESNPNCVNPRSGGVISVAYFGSEDVDVGEIDQTTLELANALPIRCALEDVVMTNPDGTVGTDGILDLVCKYKKREMALAQPGDDCQIFQVSGTFFDGMKFEGADHMCVPGDPVCDAGTPQ